jgi:hypothetical protein
MEGDLNTDHQAGVDPARKVKKHNTKGLLTIFSDQITVKFIAKDGVVEVLKGKWCLPCK